MEWKPYTPIDHKMKSTDSWALWEGYTGVLWVRKENDQWLANYVEGGNLQGEVKHNQPFEAADIEEAKAVTIALMRMS